MYLLYLDGSGSVKNSNERYFVLAGIAVFERQIYHLISEADQFVSSLDLGDSHDVELHGSVMANGNKAPWRREDGEARVTRHYRARFRFAAQCAQECEGVCGSRGQTCSIA